MDTQLIHALFWFSIGVFLHHCIFLFQNSKRQEDVYLHFIAKMHPLSSALHEQLRDAVEKKRSILKEVGMSEEQINKECEIEDQFVERWTLLFTASIMACIPKTMARKILKKNLINKGKKND